MKHRGILLFLLAALLAPVAAAQKIRSAEVSSARIRFDAFPHTGKIITVRQGEVAWSETARPADAVRLADAIPVRMRPSRTEGIPAGATLAGHRLSGGIVYCAAPDAANVNKEAQCLRDLDGDSTFDAAQITEWRHAGDENFHAYVKTIVPISKAHYEKLDVATLEAKPVRVFYAGMRKGAPLFQVSFGPTKLDEALACTFVEAGLCDFLGLRIRFTEGADKGVILTFESAAETRVFEPYRLAYPKAFE